MQLLGLMRLVVWVKRLTLAVERLADNSDEAILVLRQLYPAKRATITSPVDFSVANIETWNRAWRAANDPTYDDRESTSEERS